MAIQIQMRRGTAAAWTSADPTLAAGEVGVETDTYKAKIGDGSTAWSSLAYFAATVGYVAHGADAAAARPSGYGMVIWYGSVQPDNIAAQDLWNDSA